MEDILLPKPEIPEYKTNKEMEQDFIERKIKFENVFPEEKNDNKKL